MPLTQGRTLGVESFDRWTPLRGLSTQASVVLSLLRGMRLWPAKAIDTSIASPDQVIAELLYIRIASALEYYAGQKIKEQVTHAHPHCSRVPTNPFGINSKFLDELGARVFPESDQPIFQPLQIFFEKRHCIVHNCSLVSKKLFAVYPETNPASPGEEEAVPFSPDEVLQAVQLVLKFARMTEDQWPTRNVDHTGVWDELNQFLRDIEAEVRRLKSATI